MIIEVDKKYFIGIVAVMLILGGIFFVVSYGGTSPSVVGHDAGELTGVCKTDGTGCPVFNSCTLYRRVTSQICPAGKYVIKWDYVENSNCLGVSNSNCVRGSNGNCPGYDGALTQVAFGYIEATFCKTNLPSGSYGDVLCC